ncbi:hypothetical protein BDW42DRAFT_174880 [Aspergillus taichungensis]|uniref:Uncharacterized protein n=1 Tax=Aspergillus taichungensis TaxID=482145 RepID=A0A2J5HMP2_9EURO|nr:hypothetical protein BDW42DRAFT_174880 [Aspergillus taichungensis]
MKVSRRSSARRRNVSGGSWNGGNPQEVGHFLSPLSLLFLPVFTLFLCRLILLGFRGRTCRGVCGLVVQPLP